MPPELELDPELEVELAPELEVELELEVALEPELLPEGSLPPPPPQAVVNRQIARTGTTQANLNAIAELQRRMNAGVAPKESSSITFNLPLRRSNTMLSSH